MKGEALERKFHKLGLRRGIDFVLHLPLRYEDETVLGTPENARPGEPLQLEAKVERAQIAYRPRRQLVVHAEGLVLRFYNFYGSQPPRNSPNARTRSPCSAARSNCFSWLP